MQLLIETPDGRRYGIYPDREPIPEGKVTENCSCRFHLLGDDIDIFAVDLSVEGLRLERVAHSTDHVSWRWQIEFHAGLAELDLTGTPVGPLHLELVTDPHAAKLTRGQYAQMVGDILNDTLALLALAGHRAGVVDGDTVPPDVARFEFLRSCIDEIERAVVRVDRSPWLLLESETRYVKPGELRSATSRGLSSSARFARRLTAAEYERLSADGRRLAESFHGCLPSKVPVTRRKSHHRRREHADMMAVLLMWQSFVRVAGRRISGEANGDAVPPHYTTVARRCDVIDRRLGRLLRLPVFDGVFPTVGRIESSHLFRRVPGYRQFFEAYRDSLRGLGNVFGDFLNLPLRRTFDLYEIWCFLRLVRAAAEEMGGDFTEAFGTTGDQTGFVLKLEAQPFAFGRFVLVYHPAYKEVWRSEGPVVGSFSREMVPDIAFEFRPPRNGELQPAIVLDAKYRVETQLNDAITSIHTYRDALVQRQDADLGGVQRTVLAAFVLAPNIPGDFDENLDWQTTNAPAVFFRNEYRGVFRFGAIVLRPGASLQECRDLLKKVTNMLNDAAND